MRRTCRVSGKALEPVIDLGVLYESNFLEHRSPEAPRLPLRLGIGEESGLVQLFDTLDADRFYRHYWYRSGTNATMTRQLKDVVEGLTTFARLADGDVVLDIGCNDGTLLAQYPANRKVVKVGIDPAENLADLGGSQCDLHAVAYFNRDTFLSLTGGRKAKVITSIAMFYDLDDPNAFVKDIGECLRDDGVWVLQVSYTPLMLQQNAFDNIIHEHLEYYTLLSLDYLFKRHNLRIVDVELNNTNAGSARVTVAKSSSSLREAARFDVDLGDYRTRSLLSFEREMRLDEPQVYTDFMGRVEDLKARTVDLLGRLSREGKSVYGYGASTKGNTLLQYYGIGPDLIQAIAERQTQKHGLLTVGTWIPIVSEEAMREKQPDYLFVLPWHFINEFLDRESAFLRSGGKFIVPLPELTILG